MVKIHMENTKCIAQEQGGGGTSWVSFFFIFPIFWLVTFKREKIKIVMMRRQHIGKGKNYKTFLYDSWDYFGDSRYQI